MKTVNLRIGKRGGPFTTVPIDEPETVEEFRSLHPGDGGEKFLVDCANRGRRIRIQEVSRDKVEELATAGKTAEEIQAGVFDVLSSTDITEKQPRQAPKRKVKLPEGKTTFSADELKAMLEAQGFVIAAQPSA